MRSGTKRQLIGHRGNHDPLSFWCRSWRGHRKGVGLFLIIHLAAYFRACLMGYSRVLPFLGWVWFILGCFVAFYELNLPCVSRHNHGVCLSHFSELETGDKQAFDTHNQTPIQTRIQTRFLGRRVYRPVSSRGYKTFVSASLRVSSSSGDHRAIKSHKFVAFKSGRLNGYQNGFAFIEGDLVG